MAEGKSRPRRRRRGRVPRLAPSGQPTVRLGVSACLLGATVRYDGGHKRDAFLTETLAPFVEWVPVCPEVELGLGVPRDTLRLAGNARSPRPLVERTGEDLTVRMQRFARRRVQALGGLQLDGFVLKRGSPSCGLLGVPVHRTSRAPRAAGRGLFAAALVTHIPWLPVEEEGRLADPVLREKFIERVFAMARWRAFVAGPPRARDLVAFHATQKSAVLTRSPAHYARLERLVASTGRLGRSTLDEYGRLLMEALAVRAPRRS